jgi:nicotinate-nucleotide adenylyltransferase
MARTRPPFLLPPHAGLCRHLKIPLRIGLLGGSFNPAHDGHVYLSQQARRLLKLDAVWWLASPGNPLKANPPAPLQERVEQAERMAASHPFIHVTDIEQRMGTRYTIDTVCALKRRFPNTEFVWICGNDIAHEIHRWRQWHKLINTVSFICFNRPPAGDLVGNSAIRILPRSRQRFLTRPTDTKLTPAQWFWALQIPPNTASSTALRIAKDKP